MINEVNQAITKMDELRCQAQVLLPVLKALRAELGAERADPIILEALRGWGRQRFRQLGAGLSGTREEKWQAIKALDMERIQAGDLELQMLCETPEALEYQVTHCRYADFFRQLGEPELGAALVCDADRYLASEVTSPDVEYQRSQTIMAGASFCDIHWRIHAASPSVSG